MKVINICSYPEFTNKWRGENVTGDEYLRQQGFKSASFDNNVGWILDDDDYWMFQLLWGNRVLYAPINSN